MGEQVIETVFYRGTVQQSSESILFSKNLELFEQGIFLVRFIGEVLEELLADKQQDYQVGCQKVGKGVELRAYEKGCILNEVAGRIAWMQHEIGDTHHVKEGKHTIQEYEGEKRELVGLVLAEVPYQEGTIDTSKYDAPCAD